MPTVEVCFSPVLFPHILTQPPFAAAVVDVLRATTSITTAIEFGIKEIIPVSSEEEAKEFKKNGFILAAEKNGLKLDFADIGNSPDQFMNPELKGKSIAYLTTNGTHTIKLTSQARLSVIASFINISAVTSFLARQSINVVILCAGWKNKFSLEDSILAGAMVEKLQEFGLKIECDSAHAAWDLWKVAKNDVLKYIQKAMHRSRLQKLNLDYVLEYCFTPDKSNKIPIFDGYKIYAHE
ncbi:MAG: 2-phosphosulfolactate phosphatase [Bacteroidales bacterium]|nr:2-phosphosulfolactate phosphatase [Bacteroidales bacterium]